MKLKYLLIISAILTLGFKVQADNIAHLRTSKKIIRMDKAQAPYYAIQIIALKKPPGQASFFKAVDVAREYPCKDGFVRYTVGEFSSYREAKENLSQLKSLGYDQAFVVNTADYQMGQEQQLAKVVNKNKKKIDPSKTYTVQLSAFRFPVYLSHFENVEDVMEFRMKDKVFRYCVGEFEGTVAEAELSKIKELGYKDAYLVELDNYRPYRIE